MKKLIAVMIALLIVFGNALCEKTEMIAEEAWIVCNPESYVCMRAGPRKKSDFVGFLYAGDRIETYGENRNGWLHLANVRNEVNDGWVWAGYVTYSEPEVWTEGKPMRVARKQTRARSYVDGEVIRRLKKGMVVKVYCEALQWCVTSVGFIKTEMLEEMGME